jgi:hypothetical protein
MNQDRTSEVASESSEGDTDLEQDLAQLANQARDTIEQFVHEKPHAALGLAAALGFVIGGGLTPRRLFRIGFAAGGPALKRQLVSQLGRIASEAWLQQSVAPSAAKPQKAARSRHSRKQKP